MGRGSEPFPYQLGDLEEHCKLPSGVRGRPPAQIDSYTIFGLQMTTGDHDFYFSLYCRPGIWAPFVLSSSFFPCGAGCLVLRPPNVPNARVQVNIHLT